MPQVPELTAPSVEPGPAPDITQHIANISPEAFGSGIGSALSQVGEATGKQALAWQDLQNEAESKDLAVKAVTQIGQHEADYYQKSGKAAMDGLPDFTSAIQGVRQDTLSQATNPAVARMVDQQLARQVAYTIVGASRHAGEETKSYYNQATTSQIDLNNSRAAQAPDHDTFQSFIDNNNKSIDDMGTRNGWSPEKIQEEKLNSTTNAWSGRLIQIAQNNPLQARDLFNHIKGQLDGAQAYKLQEHINQQILSVGTKGIADSVIQGGPTQDIKDKENYAMAQLTPVMGQVGAAAVVGGMSARESKLNPLASAKGDASDGTDSVGIGQWNRERLAALKTYAQSNGKDWQDFRTQVDYIKLEATTGLRAGVAQKLRGTSDPEQATAIANHDYEGSADSSDPRASDAQRQGYQQRLAATQRLAAGGLRQPGIDPSSGPGQLERVENEAKQLAATQAAKYFPDDPNLASQYADGAVQRVRQQYGLVTAAHADAQNAATQTVYEGLETGKLKTIDDIKNDPTVGPAFASLEPTRQTSITNKLGRLTEVQRSPVTDARYNTLVGQAMTDPKGFMQVDLSKESLPETDISRLVSRRADVVKNIQAPVNGPAATVKLMATGALPSDMTKEDRQQFTGALQLRMEQFKVDNEKNPSDQDVRSMAVDLLKQTGHPATLNPTTWFGSNEPAYKRSIPDADSTSIIKAFQSKFNRAPSDVEIRDIYNRKHPVNG